jgi:hypothetical protein
MKESEQILSACIGNAKWKQKPQRGEVKGHTALEAGMFVNR